MKAKNILQILDRCCDNFTFPMLDNGYVYLAAARLSLYRSATDWAMVIEVFGFAPRSAMPDIHVHSFGSRLSGRKVLADFVNAKAYENYLATNPNNESRFFYPISEGDWRDTENSEIVNPAATHITVRGHQVNLPSVKDLATFSIILQEPSKIRTFELSRFLAAKYREKILATPEERHINVPSEMIQILQLEEWHHPDVIDDASRPSGSETFQQLANVLVSGNIKDYHPSNPPNTHWKHWPNGGTL